MEHRTHTKADEAQPPDTLFALLSDRRRRRVVEFLSGRDSPLALDELATAIAERETATKSEERPAATVAEVATALHHIHLPKLADHRIVDYDTETNTVSPARTGLLSPVLRPRDDST